MKELQDKIDSIIDCLTEFNGGNAVDESDIRDAKIELKDVKKQLAIPRVSICLERAKKYARHQHFLGTQGKELVEFDDWKVKD